METIKPNENNNDKMLQGIKKPKDKKDELYKESTVEDELEYFTE